MRKVREVLRLLWDLNQSARVVAGACNLARSTVGEYERRAVAAGLSWPLPDVDDAALEALLFPPPSSVPRELRPEPDYALVDAELRKSKLVTRQLLWQEYKAANPEGFAFSKFCDGLRKWRGEQGLSMRQTHVAGEKTFVDYAGSTVAVTDPVSGEIRSAFVFVGAMGASHYAYAEASWTQGLQDWIMSHVRMLTHFGACPEVLVPDNLKAGVKSAHLYEPDVNPTYLEFARHYGLAVIPARAGKPTDKPVVESAVQVVGRWILAKLRKRTFFSLEELNDAIWELLEGFNSKPFQKRPGSRKSVFEEVDLPAMKPLPASRYVYAQWKHVRCSKLDYHVSIEGHAYSVPFTLAGKQLEARVTAATIEVFHGGKRVASHARSSRPSGHTTVTEHMPPAHQAVAGMTPEKLRAWAERIGPYTNQFIEEVMNSRAHVQQSFKTCLGTLRLGKKYGDDRLEAACGRAVHIGSYAYKSVEAILKNRLDELPLETQAESMPKVEHENLRGASYYASNPDRRTADADRLNSERSN